MDYTSVYEQLLAQDLRTYVASIQTATRLFSTGQCSLRTHSNLVAEANKAFARSKKWKGYGAIRQRNCDLWFEHINDKSNDFIGFGEWMALYAIINPSRPW